MITIKVSSRIERFQIKQMELKDFFSKRYFNSFVFPRGRGQGPNKWVTQERQKSIFAQQTPTVVIRKWVRLKSRAQDYLSQSLWSKKTEIINDTTQVSSKISFVLEPVIFKLFKFTSPLGTRIQHRIYLNCTFWKKNVSAFH